MWLRICEWMNNLWVKPPPTFLFVSSNDWKLYVLSVFQLVKRTSLTYFLRCRIFFKFSALRFCRYTSESYTYLHLGNVLAFVFYLLLYKIVENLQDKCFSLLCWKHAALRLYVLGTMCISGTLCFSVCSSLKLLK